jgi:hypothetical protein
MRAFLGPAKEGLDVLLSRAVANHVAVDNREAIGTTSMMDDCNARALAEVVAPRRAAV